MTREEAVEYIQEWLKDEYALNGKDRVVLNMAIEALEQEPCEDAVSRKAVLDKAYAYGNGLEPEGYCVEVEDIQALPPVVPTHKKGKWLPIIEVNEFGEPYQSGIYCSECGEILKCEANYCPNCGANMKEVDDEID